MKLTKENIYVDLKGKSKEDLTELYWLLSNNNEVIFRSFERFLEYPFDIDSHIGFCELYNHWGSGVNLGSREEVTIEQLKEILKPMEEALTLENIQVDCRKLTRKQIKEMAKISGYKKGNLECYQHYNYFRIAYDTCNVGVYEESKTTITYDKFMELFGNKETELLNNKNMVNLMGYSVLVDNKEQARKLQETAFEQGFKWAVGAEELNLLGEESFQFGYGGGKVITYNYGGNHFQDDFITKTAHFNDLFETLQEKEQRLLKELEEVRKEIEEDSNIKIGDWVVNTHHGSVFKNDTINLGINHPNRYKKITNPQLIKLLEQEIK